MRTQLGELEGIERLPNQSIAEVNAFIKAARLYQQAVWIADPDPELAWLLLISCVETIAVIAADDEGSPVERLRETIPKLAELLERNLTEPSFAEAAAYTTRFTGSTRKFVQFLAKFAPDAARPTSALRSVWI